MTRPAKVYRPAVGLPVRVNEGLGGEDGRASRARGVGGPALSRSHRSVWAMRPVSNVSDSVKGDGQALRKSLVWLSRHARVVNVGMSARNI